MAVFEFKISLYSDAQPGTGLGSEFINDYIPRNLQGHPICPGSHIKGLMREALSEIFKNLGLKWDILHYVLGKAFETDRDNGSCFQLTDAVVTERTYVTKWVSRTALDEEGTAKDMSLRTDEAVSTDSVFTGTLISHCAPNSLEECVWQLGLLSIFAIGGNRNRGCGRCKVSITGVQKKPSDLIQRLVRELPEWKRPESSKAADESTRTWNEWVPVRLTFTADSSVCVPATAASKKTNVQITDFSIPASAVRGMLLHRFLEIKEAGEAVVSSLFKSSQFLAWPLQPCGVVGDKNESGGSAEMDGKLPPNYPVSVRVSLTHRAGKFSVEQAQEPEFQDQAWEDLKPEKAPPKVQMKAADGVLFVENAQSKPQLWKASAMPHDIRSHGVHANAMGQKRNLYTMDSMAPMVWRGLVMLPKDLAKLLSRSLESNSRVAFGTHRSVQGIGVLTAEVLNETPAEWTLPPDANYTVFIVQSPISIPDVLLCPEVDASKSLVTPPKADDQLRAMVEEWLAKNEIKDQDFKVWANTGLLFGWNVKNRGLQRPRLVILPGSVIQLSKKLEAGEISKLLSKGFYLVEDDPQRGFGAICVHPGKADRLYKRSPKRQVLKKSKPEYAQMTQEVLDLMNKEHLPSASQVRSLRKKNDVLASLAEVKEYLRLQCQKDGSYQDWGDNIGKVISSWYDGKYKMMVINFGLDMLVDLILTQGAS